MRDITVEIIIMMRSTYFAMLRRKLMTVQYYMANGQWTKKMANLPTPLFAGEIVLPPSLERLPSGNI
jgi:hypothetical protein